MGVTSWSNIYVDQGQFSDPDFISGTHQRENDTICRYFTIMEMPCKYVVLQTRSLKKNDNH